MQASVKWIEGFTFFGHSESGHSIIMDGDGGKKAPSPMEMVLIAAGGCSSIDVVDGLKAEGQKIISCEAKLSSIRRDIAPKLFTQINIHFELCGENLDSSIIEKVTAASLQKYCSVCLMLGESVEMSHSWEIVM